MHNNAKAIRFRFVMITVLLTIALMASSTGTVFGSAGPYVTMEQANKEASDLKALGLFLGSDKGFELDRAPTRLEGLIMLIRLMGEEKDAKECSYDHPFKDVPAWGNGYIAWAYYQGYTAGTSATTFTPNKNMNAAEYFAFVLRALGYGSDFKWPYSAEKAKELLIVPYDTYSDTSVPFLRADVVHISFLALKAAPKGMKGSPLYSILGKNEVIDSDVAAKMFKTVKLPVTPQASELMETQNAAKPAKAHVEVDNPDMPGSTILYSYSYTNTNNKMSSCTVSVQGDTLSISGTETATIDGIKITLSKKYNSGRTYSGTGLHNDFEWNFFKDIPVSDSKYSMNLLIPDTEWGYYYIIAVFAFRNNYDVDIMNLTLRRDGDKGWYLDYPVNLVYNEEMAYTSDAAASEWLDNIPEGNLAEKIRSYMPEANKSNYEAAKEIYMRVSQKILWLPGFTSDLQIVMEAGMGSSGEITDLMISALNLYGIPARKVIGENKLAYGDGAFHKSFAIEPMLVFYEMEEHPWVEFLDENKNWISCDPTLGTLISPYSWFDINKYYLSSGASILRYE